MAGMAVAATSAALASFTGLRGLAEISGWPSRLAWLLPVTLDAYAMTATRVWLAPSGRSAPARRFARANATGAIAVSVAGNAAYHALEAGLLEVTWPIIVAVGSVPAVVLGLTTHLHAMRPGHAPAPAPVPRQSGSGAGPRSRTGAPPDRARSPRRRRRPRPRDDASLLTAAREADTRHRAEHGRPITRDALRRALRISGPRASALRRELAADHSGLESGSDAGLEVRSDNPTSEVPDRKESATTR
jgi:hypothetical protein